MTRLISEQQANAEVAAVYNDIKAVRQIDWVSNFWKALAVSPPDLSRVWTSVKAVMAPGALDPLTKELIYLAVSVNNGCDYCIAAHSAAARAKGMTEAQFAELLSVVGLASQNNRLAVGYRIPIDERFFP